MTDLSGTAPPGQPPSARLPAAAPSPGPLVSVAMPFWNVAPYLAEAIESVRTQTYSDWELFLIDDGSTDGSTGIAQRFAAQDPVRIRWIEHPGHANLGASASRNVGLRLARGEYFAMLDGDDVWLSHKLSEQIALLDVHPDADVLCGSTEFWYGWTGLGANVQKDHVVRIGVPDGSLLSGSVLLALMLRGAIAVPCTCSVIARREAVLRVGGFEERFRTVFTDQAFYAKLLLDASVLVVDTCWDRYRQHSAGSCIVAERSGVLQDEQLKYLRWLENYLAADPLRDSADVREALRLAFWRAEHPRLARASRRCRHAMRSLRAAASPLPFRRTPEPLP